MDLHVMAQLEKILSKLKNPIYLLSLDGACLFPENSIRYRLPALSDQIVTVDGRSFMKCEAVPDLVLMVNAQDENRAFDLLSLAQDMIRVVIAANDVGNDLSNTYQRLLQDEIVPGEAQTMAEEYRIPLDLPRCVLIMHMMQVNDKSCGEILSEILPIAPGDVIVSLDKHQIAFIKDATGIEDLDELAAFAFSAQQTLLEELGLAMTVGIGDIFKAPVDMHSSFRQARRAIEIGRTYDEGQSVFIYSRMLLPRFFSDIPADVASHYHSLLFNRSTARLFNEDTLRTVDMFFKKDLNLSDTARQLYIHRNTLVYRLDKIQKQCGLDLRSFEDAVTFKMLYEMKKCCVNKNKKKK